MGRRHVCRPFFRANAGRLSFRSRKAEPLEGSRDFVLKAATGVRRACGAKFMGKKFSLILGALAMVATTPLSAAAPPRGDEPVAVPRSIKQGIDFVYVDPQMSNVAIAEHCGSSDKTVADIRREMESGSEIPNLNSRTGLDGKTYSARDPAVNGDVTPDDNPFYATEDEEAAGEDQHRGPDGLRDDRSRGRLVARMHVRRRGNEQSIPRHREVHARTDKGIRIDSSREADE